MRKVWAECLSILLPPFFLSQLSCTWWQCIGVCVCVCQQTLAHLHAVVMGAFSVEVAAVVVDAAVVQRAEAHEAVLQGVVALLVHVVVPDHVLLAGEPLETRERVAAGQEGGGVGGWGGHGITVQVSSRSSGGDGLCGCWLTLQVLKWRQPKGRKSLDEEHPCRSQSRAHCRSLSLVFH